MAEDTFVHVTVHGNPDEGELAMVRDTVGESLKDTDLTGVVVVTDTAVRVRTEDMDRITEAVAQRLEDDDE